MRAIPEPSNKNQHSAFTAATKTIIGGQAWYPDSGASNHVADNANNLHSKHDYDGKEGSVIGNGEKLLIKHIGKA